MADEQKLAGDMAKTSKSVERSLEDKIAAGVAKWIDAHLRDTPFSADTPAWNHLQAALPHLVGAIKEEVN